MIPKIARSQNWSIPVLVDNVGNVFYQVNPQLTLPFVTSANYELLDYSDLHCVTSKLKLAEMKITKLEKQVADNYSGKYLEKFFKETIIEIPDLMLTQKIVSAYSEFLDAIIMGDGEWHKRNQELNKIDLPNIDKDLARIKMFHEFMGTLNKIKIN